MLILKGKTALITGGATGIGRATALRLAKEGVNIVINYSRSEDDALKTMNDVKRFGAKAIIYKADVSSDNQVRQMIADAVNTFGKLHILVNNAGVTDFVKLDDLEGLKEEHWDRSIGVNVKGLFYCCRAAASELKENKGCIVNITSVAGLTGKGSSIAYAASKSAAISVTKSLAFALAPDVRVNSISPGSVKTRWHEGREERVKYAAANTLLQRPAYSEDIAEVVFSLIAHSSYITGQNIIVDGGTIYG